MLSGKNIVVGVTGGIAVYKVADLVSALVKRGAAVHVIMTRAACAFVAPLTFQTLTGNPVHTEMFDKPGQWHVEHISLADRADLFLVAPATANIIGKVASGIADDLLSTSLMATTAPVLFAPAMNVNMYLNRIVRENMKKLERLGYLFVGPGTGRLACGYEGKGRLIENAAIIAAAEEALSRVGDLKDLNILITAGPTREFIDPVRFITNPSTGKMGYAIAAAAARRGAEVILVSGPTSLTPPPGVTMVSVTSAEDMFRAVKKNYRSCDIIIKSAAVGDYRPLRAAASKIKKTGDNISLELSRTQDILAFLGEHKDKRVLIGFAAETDNLLKNAQGKAVRKNLDMIVANDVTKPGAGFAVDTNTVTFVYPDGRVEPQPGMDKKALADVILDRVVGLVKSRKK